jgi:2-hydroxychromene-2-carboxylate isomerase
VLPLLFTIPWGRAIWARYTWWLLGVQAVLTYLPFVMFGRLWAVGLSGLRGGLLLLTLPALATALFDAYFRDGLNVADHTQLTELAERVRLDGRRVRDFLATEDGGCRST